MEASRKGSFLDTPTEALGKCPFLALCRFLAAPGTFWLWAHGNHPVCISTSFSYKDTSILGKGPPFLSVNFPAMIPFPSKAAF